MGPATARMREEIRCLIDATKIPEHTGRRPRRSKAARVRPVMQPAAWTLARILHLPAA